VETALKRLTDEVAAFLPEIKPSGEDAKAIEILRRYCTLIQPNFVRRWLMDTWYQCKSEVAKEACRDNLEVEVKDDHPAMLHRFVAQCRNDTSLGNRWPLSPSAHMCADVVTAVCRPSYWNASGLGGLLVLAGLETTSLVFVSDWMAEAAEILRLEDRQYIAVHGEADIEHAKEFANAVVAEAQEINLSVADLEQQTVIPLRNVSDLLRGIFVTG